jgi:hypothetical protein
LCESAFGGLGYLRTNWNDSKYVWSNYERGAKYLDWCSYVVGNESYMRIFKNIDTSNPFEVSDNQKIEELEIIFRQHIYISNTMVISSLCSEIILFVYMQRIGSVRYRILMMRKDFISLSKILKQNKT